MKTPIKGAHLKLTDKDGNLLQTTTDSLGNYSFTNGLKTGVDYIFKIASDTAVGRSKEIKYGLCPNGYCEKHGYFGVNDHTSFTYSDTLKKSNYDFCLTPIIVDYVLPSFYFKKNSTDFSEAAYNDDLQNADTCMDCFVSLLMANKHWTIEIAGHASAEEVNKPQLAAARAKKLFDLLVSKGIDPKRLYCKSYSDKRPYEFFDESGNSIKKDQASINKKSKRISLSVITKDYDPLIIRVHE